MKHVIAAEELFAETFDEMALLTCLMYNPRLIKRIADRLKPTHFYRDIYQVMYEIILTCYQHNKRCTTDMMRYELKKRDRLEDALGHGRFDEMVRNATFDSRITMSDVEALATTIIEEATYRSLSLASCQIMQLAHSRSADAVSQALALLSDIALGVDSVPTSTLAIELDAYVAELEQRRIDLVEGNARGLSTGFAELDKMTGGLQPSCLLVLAALTGLGKTAFAVNIALNIALQAKRVLFISLEMDNGEIVQRIIAMETMIDQFLLNRGEIDDVQMQQIKARAQQLKQCDFLMDDRTYNIEDICTKARKEHAINPLHLIVVDYVQLVESCTDGRRHETRAEEVGKLSRSLKRLARDLKVPVLALAQVNRKVEEQAEPEPKLSHLSESAGLATNANIVIFLHTTKEELVKREQNRAFTIWAKVAKGRNARMGQVPLLFAPRITKFSTHPGIGMEQEEMYDDEQS